MKGIFILFISIIFSITACNQENNLINSVDATPIVKRSPSYSFVKDSNIVYAEGLVHDNESVYPFSSNNLGNDSPLMLDVYYPVDRSNNRPVFMWIHGGGFTGGTKTKVDIVEMAEYYATRGWVFISIDYRTTEELCDAEHIPACKDKLKEMVKIDRDKIIDFYTGIAPQEWVSYVLNQNPDSPKKLQQSIAQYTAQRDAKAALRWIVANASAYNINTDYITVGGNSAGSITTIALGISSQEDFKEEISLDDDPTLSTTHLNERYDVKSMVYFWGSNDKLDLHERVYDLKKYERYDANDPELFMGHGKAEDLQTPYEGALELQSVYDSLGIYNELNTLVYPPDDNPAGHGAWDAEVDGVGLFELSFNFIVSRQKLSVE